MFFVSDFYFIIVGGRERKIFVWKTSECTNQVVPSPQYFETMHESKINCLAVTINSGAVLSGSDGNLICYDVIRCAFLYIYHKFNL